MKDHRIFKALALLKLKNKNYLCILAGTNIDKNNKILINQILQLKLKNNVKLIGKCNIPLLMNAIDIYSKRSYGEGFPNVVAEAMACKILALLQMLVMCVCSWKTVGLFPQKIQ